MYRQGVRKALNLVDDDMNFSPQTTTTNGFGWKEIAALGLTAVSGGTLFTLAPLLQQALNPSPTAPPTPPAVSSPDDSEYEVIIRDSVTKQPIRIDWVSPQ